MKQHKKVSRQQRFINNVGAVCGMFRKRKLSLTLKDMSNLTGVPVPTLNAFELGRSSSLRILFLYYDVCDNHREQRLFLMYLVESFEFFKKDE